MGAERINLLDALSNPKRDGGIADELALASAEIAVGIEFGKYGSTVNISARPPRPSVSRRDCAHRPASRHPPLARSERPADARPHCSQCLSNSPPRGRFR